MDVFIADLLVEAHRATELVGKVQVSGSEEIFCEFLMFVEQGEAKLVEHKTKGWTNPNETTPFWTFL